MPRKGRVLSCDVHPAHQEPPRTARSTSAWSDPGVTATRSARHCSTWEAALPSTRSTGPRCANGSRSFCRGMPRGDGMRGAAHRRAACRPFCRCCGFTGRQDAQRGCGLAGDGAPALGGCRACRAPDDGAARDWRVPATAGLQQPVACHGHGVDHRPVVRESDWLGTGGFKNFLCEVLDGNVRLSLTPPGFVYDLRRHKALNHLSELREPMRDLVQRQYVVVGLPRLHPHRRAVRRRGPSTK